MKHLFVIGFLPLFAASGLAVAGGAGATGAGYVGVAIGSTNSNANRSNLTYPDTCNLKVSNCSSDDKDRAWQLHAGYEFTPNIAVEGAYVDLGKTADVRSKGVGGSLHGKQDTKGVSVSVVGKAPLGMVAGYGKVGAYRWDSDVKVDGPSANNKASASGTGATLGLGVEYRINGNVSARAGWDRYYNTGKDKAMLKESGAGTLRTDVDVYSVGLSYHF